MLNFNVYDYLINPPALLNNDYPTNYGTGTSNVNSIFDNNLLNSLNSNSSLNNNSTTSSLASDTSQGGILGSLVQILSMLANLISNNQNGTTTSDGTTTSNNNNNNDNLTMGNNVQDNVNAVMSRVNMPDLSGLINEIQNDPGSGVDTQSRVESYLLANYGGNIDQVIQNLTGLQSLPSQIQSMDSYIFDQIVETISNQVDNTVQEDSLYNNSSSNNSSYNSGYDYTDESGYNLF